MTRKTTQYDGPIDWEIKLCEHHQGGVEPTIRPDPALPLTWAVAECPICEHACQVDTESGEVRTL